MTDQPYGRCDFAPSQKPPAKVKDPGLVSLVTSGKGAYNAREGRILLLPRGLSQRRHLVSKVEEWISSMGGVLCGGASSFEHLRSLAERYMRDHGIELWGAVREDQALIALFRPGQSPGLPVPPFKGLEEVLEVFEEGLRVLWVARADEAMRSSEVLSCRSCGGLFSAHHPMGGGETGTDPSHLLDEMPPAEQVHTPSASTIVELCSFLGVEPGDTLKTVAVMDQDGRRVAALLLAGHMVLSYPKASRALGYQVQMASDLAVERAFGDCAGFLGPLGLPPSVPIIAHDDLKRPRPMVAGANRRDWHVRNLVVGRDFKPRFADLAALGEGDLCPSCGKDALGSVLVRVVGEAIIPDSAGDLGFVCSSPNGRVVYDRVALGRLDLEELHLALEDGEIGAV